MTKKSLPKDRIIRLSIVAPCYNEEEVIGELHSRCIAAAKAVVGDAFELLLVDDGSTDRSRDMIRRLTQTCPYTVAIFLSRNHGHQKALSAGLKFTCGDRILAIDADLQDPPELLGPMMKKMDEGNDVVFGQRSARKGETIFKKTSAALFYRLLNQMIDTSLPVDTGDFRLMSRRVVEHLNDMPEEDRFIRGMVGWLGFRQAAFQYERSARFAGETKYPLRLMLRLALNAITSFSTVPLRLATLIAVLMAGFGMLFVLYVLVQWSLGNTIPGWSSVMIVLLTAGSAQLLTIGILGEYIGRLYMQSKRRPSYIVQEVLTGVDLTGKKIVRTVHKRVKEST